MSQVLMLNADYLPLRVISIKRAIVLLVQDKAEALDSSGEEWRSESVAIPVPTVIKLRYFVKLPFRSSVPLSNKGVLVRDRWECAYCGERANTVDHVHPRSKGGKHEWTNVVAACRTCNQKKGNRLLEQTSLKLRFQPRVPKANTWLVIGKIVDEAWEPYLEPVFAA